MRQHVTDVKGWEQLQVFPREGFQIDVSVGLLPVENHYQWQIEVRDLATGDLVAMFSRPHFVLDMLDDELSSVLDMLRTWSSVAVDPFRDL